jgi:outer membrane lipoprotein carrier protein
MFSFKSFIKAGLLSLSFVILSAQAVTPPQQLAGLLNQYQSLSANFIQTIYDANGTLQQQSTGNMKLLRPDYFWWNTTSPNRQLIATNGKKLWVYDIDLEQVTIQQLQKAAGEAPAMLLTTSGADLAKDFLVTNQAPVKGEQVFQLSPKDPKADYAWIRLFFKDNTISKMQIRDNMGQTTMLEFRLLQVNPKLTPTMFKVSIPKGTDIINA